MHTSHALIPAVILLASGLVALLVSHRAHMSPIAGFVIVGLALGEHGFGLLEDTETTRLLAELGVAFLLFDIGLHFSVDEVRGAGRDFAILGPIQMSLCTAVFTVTARMLGVDWMLALVLGAGLALSSTVAVVRVLAERGMATSPLGRSATAVLVFQDIIAIFILILAHSFTDAPSSVASAAGLAAIKAAFVFAVGAGVSRFIARPGLALIGRMKSDEILLTAVLFLVLAASATTSELGLSLTLGAFIAGLMVADSPFRSLVRAEMRPFRALLTGFFFIAVGMALDPMFLLSAWPAVIALALGIMVVKTALIFLAARLSGRSAPASLQLSFILGQASEFALIILAIPVVAGGVPGNAAALLVAAAVLTLAVTPAWTWAGMLLARRMAADAEEAAPAPTLAPQPAEVEPVLIVLGLTRAGRMAVDAARAFDLPVRALETDLERYTRAKADGYAPSLVLPANADFTRALSSPSVRAVVFGDPSMITGAAVTAARGQHYLAVNTPEDEQTHAAVGRAVFLTDDTPAGLALSEAMLEHLDFEREAVSAWADDVRARAGEAPVNPEAAPDAA